MFQGGKRRLSAVSLVWYSMDFTTQADFQDELFSGCLSCLLWRIRSPFQKYCQSHLCWEVRILAWAGFKPLPKKIWAHLPVVLVPSTMYLFEQERCCLFGNRVFSRHLSSIKAIGQNGKLITSGRWSTSVQEELFCTVKKRIFLLDFTKGNIGFNSELHCVPLPSAV